MMELNNWFQRDWTKINNNIGWFFIGRFTYKTGSWRNTGISEKTGYSEKKEKKLIDIGLRAAFGGYWKLFMDGNSLDIGFSGCLFLSINLYQMYNLHIPRPIACFLVFPYTAFTAPAVAFRWSFRLFPNERRSLTTYKLLSRIIRNPLIS
jgi:hypothetical protein